MHLAFVQATLTWGKQQKKTVYRDKITTLCIYFFVSLVLMECQKKWIHLAIIEGEKACNSDRRMKNSRLPGIATNSLSSRRKPRLSADSDYVVEICEALAVCGRKEGSWDLAYGYFHTKADIDKVPAACCLFVFFSLCVSHPLLLRWIPQVTCQVSEAVCPLIICWRWYESLGSDVRPKVSATCLALSVWSCQVQWIHPSLIFLLPLASFWFDCFLIYFSFTTNLNAARHRLTMSNDQNDLWDSEQFCFSYHNNGTRSHRGTKERSEKGEVWGGRIFGSVSAHPERQLPLPPCSHMTVLLAEHLSCCGFVTDSPLPATERSWGCSNSNTWCTV